jgi:chemotaxis protein MotA
MDIATLVGLFIGSVLLFWAMAQSGSLFDFLSPAALAVVLGGTLAATLVNYPLPRFMAAIRGVRHAFADHAVDLAQLSQLIVSYAKRARREGLLALEEEAEDAPDPFLRKGLGLLVDGTDPAMVRTILENDLNALEERHKQGAALFDSMAQFAPAFGLVGTLIGLVRMLRGMDDPSRIGPGLAVALLTTLYGALLANLLFLPMAGKLRIRSAEELLRKEVMLEGVLAIQAGDGPAILTERLSAFLSPGEREQQDHRAPGGRLITEEDG